MALNLQLLIIKNQFIQLCQNFVKACKYKSIDVQMMQQFYVESLNIMETNNEALETIAQGIALELAYAPTCIDCDNSIW